MNRRRTFILALAGIALALGTAAAYAVCTWGWEQDSCADVLCPTGCYQTTFGGPQSKCNMQGYLICCNCWYRERICYFNGTSTRCYRAVPPAPNSYAWQCIREDSIGLCNTDTLGTKCESATNPWPLD